MSQLEQRSKDALSETRDVLTDLGQFLSLVGRSASSEDQAELKDIEDSLGATVNKIASLNGIRASHPPVTPPHFEKLRCV